MVCIESPDELQALRSYKDFSVYVLRLKENTVTVTLIVKHGTKSILIEKAAVRPGNHRAHISLPIN